MAQRLVRGMSMLMALAAGTAAVARGSDAPPKRTITLTYIADLHAQLESHPELFWGPSGEELTEAGGLARIATAIRGIREERPDGVMFLDAGDTIQGSAAAAWTEGRAVMPGLNALGLDLAIPGNWEVVYGKQAMLDRAGESRHPWIAANVRDAATGELVFRPYEIREIGGVRVAVIGFTDPDVPERQPPSYSRGLAFEKDGVLQPLIDEVRSEHGPDLVVLLLHIGLPKAVVLAERLQGVDVVLSGDTHERTYEPIVRGETWVVEPGGFGSFLGRLDVTVEGGHVVDRRWQLLELRADRFAEAPDVKAIVEETLAPLRERLDRVVGETSVTLSRYDVVETNLDAMLSDSLREASGSEIALSNGFRFAGPTPPGKIRERDLWNWYPISTKLETGIVTGQQIREFWERELENVFAADPARLFGGWLPRPSGLTVTFEAHAPKGERVREIRVGDQPLEEDRLYTIVACDREGDAPDKLCRIPGVRDARVLDIDAHEAVRRHLAKHEPLRQPSMRRVVALDLTGPVRSQVMGRVHDKDRASLVHPRGAANNGGQGPGAGTTGAEMSNLLAARWQMALSLGFHIIFASIGIALPLLMAIAEFHWLRTGDPVYRQLAKNWARGAAILFAVGAVSGTVLSFELGLLWPSFMEFAGPIVGVGFGLEGFAFFTEAIFLGIYLYGWDRIPPLMHWLAGVLVASSGALSGMLVVAVNAWMNTPAGFRLVGSVATDIDPVSALSSPATISEGLHMTIAAYAATGMLVAGVHAAMMLRDRDNVFHRRALSIALVAGGVASALQPVSGHYAAQVVARTQPAKLAAMEGQFRTERGAPLRIGGIPDPDAGVTRYAIEIPRGLSVLAFNDPDAEVKGLESIPEPDRPPVRVVHLAFQLMVGCGMAMLGLAVWGGVSSWRHRRVPDGRAFLIALALASPLGMLAIEAGWTVTEVGRQPWIVQSVMRTAAAVTPVPGLWVSLLSYTVLYVLLGIAVVVMLMKQFRESPSSKVPEEVPQ